MNVDCSANYTNPVSYKMLEGSVGYVRILSFDAGSGEAAIAAVDKLLADGALTSHLAETERLAQEMADDLTARMAASQRVDEAMKSADPMGWAAKMGAIREEARSTAIRELVFA